MTTAKAPVGEAGVPDDPVQVDACDRVQCGPPDRSGDGAGGDVTPAWSSAAQEAGGREKHTSSKEHRDAEVR